MARKRSDGRNDRRRAAATASAAGKELPDCPFKAAFTKNAEHDLAQFPAPVVELIDDTLMAFRIDPKFRFDVVGEQQVCEPLTGHLVPRWKLRIIPTDGFRSSYPSLAYADPWRRTPQSWRVVFLPLASQRRVLVEAIFSHTSGYADAQVRLCGCRRCKARAGRRG